MKACWIKCDIDGAGRKWRLAVERTSFTSGSAEVYFVEEDHAEEMTLAEYREEFPKNEIVEITPPPGKVKRTALGNEDA